MPTKDKCCTIVPYFDVPAHNAEAFRAICERCVERAQDEEKCL